MMGIKINYHALLYIFRYYLYAYFQKFEPIIQLISLSDTIDPWFKQAPKFAVHMNANEPC